MLLDVSEIVDVLDWKIWVPLVVVVIGIPLIRYVLNLSATQKLANKNEVLSTIKTIIDSVIQEVEVASKESIDKAGGKKNLAVLLSKELLKKIGVKSNFVTDALLATFVEEAVVAAENLGKSAKSKDVSVSAKKVVAKKSSSPSKPKKATKKPRVIKK